MKKLAVYPGSFDPITNGHIDIIARASAIFDEVIVAVLVNANKTPTFTTKQRVEQIRAVTKNFKNVKVDSFKGLLADFMRQKECNIVVRGLRAVTDLEYEFMLANTNNKLNKNIETIFFMPSEKNTYVNSSMVKEAYSLGGRLPQCVPALIDKELIKKYK